MKSGASGLWISSLFFLIIGLWVILFIGPDMDSFISFWVNLDYQSFKIIFLSIVLEAAPFIMLGVIISSLLQITLSEERLQRIIPKNPVIGILAASMMGILFPVCECGMIPVARKLIQKGMPAYLGITYMLAAPIVNPVVYFATYSAFRTTPSMVNARMLLAYGVAAITGFLVYFFVRRNPLRFRAQELGANAPEQSRFSWQGWFEHMLNDFFNMTKYLLFGAFIAASIQVMVARSTLIDIGADAWSSYPFMMVLTYILSLCSTSDAFVAASFSGAFNAGPLLAFMVLGPMLDFKSTLMMLSAFRFRFVLFLVAILVVLVWIGSVVAGQFL